ncbi:hypothetical protein FOMPIDRAFT_1023644 [Fomitopsis schrenkii]|uniref:Uncharacterized protein n=1 Tax=Fomitopsis schrenkii TaxID=2126942 RepID=S8E6T5_FOMSC|nr:hypothetical protein FOMPIDRAFT_1023644 [Fomitopsis schrenkii]
MSELSLRSASGSATTTTVRSASAHEHRRAWLDSRDSVALVYLYKVEPRQSGRQRYRKPQWMQNS